MKKIYYLPIDGLSSRKGTSVGAIYKSYFSEKKNITIIHGKPTYQLHQVHLLIVNHLFPDERSALLRQWFICQRNYLLLFEKVEANLS